MTKLKSNFALTSDIPYIILTSELLSFVSSSKKHGRDVSRTLCISFSRKDSNEPFDLII